MNLFILSGRVKISPTRGSVDNLTGTNTVSPTFTAPNVTSGQQFTDLTFKLVLNDSYSNSVPSFITVRVLNTNDPPSAVAKAGTTLETLSTDSVSLNENENVLLDGNSSTDQNVGDMLTYSWTQVGASNIVITGANTPNASFKAPLVPKAGDTFAFKLTVTDQDGANSESYISVVAGDVNHQPLPSGGADANAPARSSVSLDGGSSGDTDGNNLTYSWMQTGGTTVVLNNANTATPSFTAPTVATSGEDLTFELTVNDGAGYTNSSATDSVTIHVTYVNRAPKANAGPGQTPDENTVVTLDGSGSTDDDMNTLANSWLQISGPAVVLSDATAAKPTFTAPEVTRDEADIVFGRGDHSRRGERCRRDPRADRRRQRIHHRDRRPAFHPARRPARAESGRIAERPDLWRAGLRGGPVYSTAS